MKRFTKIIIPLLLIGVMTLVVFPAFAATDTEHELKMDIQETAGGQVAVSVQLTGNTPQLDALQFDISYDQAAFTLKNVVDGGLWGAATINTDYTVYPYSCNWYAGNGTKPPAEGGTVVTFYFDVNQAAQKMPYDFDIGYRDGEAFGQYYVDGSVPATVYFGKVTETYYGLTVRGDVNSDGMVDDTDLNMTMQYINGSGTLADEKLADLEEDGKINVLDLQQMYVIAHP